MQEPELHEHSMPWGIITLVASAFLVAIMLFGTTNKTEQTASNALPAASGPAR